MHLVLTSGGHAALFFFIQICLFSSPNLFELVVGQHHKSRFHSVVHIAFSFPFLHVSILFALSTVLRLNGTLLIIKYSD